VIGWEDLLSSMRIMASSVDCESNCCSGGFKGGGKAERWGGRPPPIG